MNKKIIFTLCAAVAALSSSVVFAEEPCQASLCAAADCSSMSMDEKAFADNLMDMSNKMAFCSQFNSTQRASAMQMVGKPDSTGNMMTADQAVSSVRKEYNMMAPAASSKAGGCPVQ